jgi:hypothetical protein
MRTRNHWLCKAKEKARYKRLERMMRLDYWVFTEEYLLSLKLEGEHEIAADSDVENHPRSTTQNRQ